MSTDFEQRLRAEMEQVTVRPRPGLVNEAYRSYRGKRRTTRTVAAAGTALVIAAGTAAGVAAATASPTAIPAQSTAYIVNHVSSALATSDEISYTIMGMSLNPSVAVQQVSYTWKYGNRWRELVDTGSGQPVTDSWAQVGVSQALVIYPDRVWARYGFAPGPALGACSEYAANFPILVAAGPMDLSSVVEAGLRCGAFHVAGHQRVDGVDTIKLTGSSYRGKPTITLWVDARTYLPVQGTGEGTVMQFRWLPPTQANLAQLTGTIPPGFHRG